MRADQVRQCLFGVTLEKACVVFRQKVAVAEFFHITKLDISKGRKRGEKNKISFNIQFADKMKLYYAAILYDTMSIRINYNTKT